jgi:putative endonuclease
MQVIYVLKSLIDQKLYIGCTSNLDKRINYHNQGKVKSTKNRRPLVLIYKEDYANIYEAFNAERYYKTAKGKRDLKNKMALSSNG